MYLIFSCIFVNENYLNLVDKLLTTYSKYNDNDKICYLIITSKNFESKIKQIFLKTGIKNHDIWILDIGKNDSMTSNIYESTYSRYYIYKYPNIKYYEKILYLDCDILITNCLDKLFSFELEDLFYFVHEPMHRYCHCALFNDNEYKNLDSKCTFTTAIILFKNNTKMITYMSEIYKFIKDFHNKYENPLPAYDQPIVNKICLDNKIYNNISLKNYCLNMMPRDGIDKISLIPKYLLCHFATNVGDHIGKIDRATKVIDLLKI